MRYLGNKTRLAKHLEPYLRKHLDGTNWFIEPFAGAMGMISNLDYPNRIAYDCDPYIIKLMKAVRDGWNPPEDITDEQYKEIRKTIDYTKQDVPLIGFVGYGCSFGGKWFGGLARGGTNNGIARNHVAESSRNLIKMRPKLQGIKMQICEYSRAKFGESNVVYCDPPYSTGTQYKSDFDHEHFWSWVRVESMRNFVYTSEYNAPEDFRAIWQKEHKSGIDSGAKVHKPTVEKLWVYNKGFTGDD